MDTTSALHAELTRARGEAVARVAEFDAVVRELAQARSDSDTDDEHDPEGSTLSWDRAVQAASADAARHRLAEIDAALDRLEAGWDGACVACGRPIPAERLAARPGADRCVACAGRARR